MSQQGTERCVWTEDGDGVFQTACGHSFVFDTDGPVENKQRFCGYCGGKLVEDRRGQRRQLDSTGAIHAF